MVIQRAFQHQPSDFNQSAFLSVPAEIRVKILRYSLRCDLTIHPWLADPVQYEENTTLSSQLLRTCQQLFHEGSDVLYRGNTFGIQITATSIDFLSSTYPIFDETSGALARFDNSPFDGQLLRLCPELITLIPSDRFPKEKNTDCMKKDTSQITSKPQADTVELFGKLHLSVTSGSVAPNLTEYKTLSVLKQCNKFDVTVTITEDRTKHNLNGYAFATSLLRKLVNGAAVNVIVIHTAAGPLMTWPFELYPGPVTPVKPSSRLSVTFYDIFREWRCSTFSIQDVSRLIVYQDSRLLDPAREAEIAKVKELLCVVVTSNEPVSDNYKALIQLNELLETSETMQTYLKRFKRWEVREIWSAWLTKDDKEFKWVYDYISDLVKREWYSF